VLAACRGGGGQGCGWACASSSSCLLCAAGGALLASCFSQFRCRVLSNPSLGSLSACLGIEGARQGRKCENVMIARDGRESCAN